MMAMYRKNNECEFGVEEMVKVQGEVDQGKRGEHYPNPNPSYNM